MPAACPHEKMQEAEPDSLDVVWSALSGPVLCRIKRCWDLPLLCGPVGAWRSAGDSVGAKLREFARTIGASCTASQSSAAAERLASPYVALEQTRGSPMPHAPPPPSDLVSTLLLGVQEAS